MSAAWLEALFGRIYNGTTQLALSKGISFGNGLTAALNTTTKIVEVALTEANIALSRIGPVNEFSVVGKAGAGAGAPGSIGVTADSVVARAGSGVVAPLAVPSNTVVGRAGSGLVAAQIVTGQIADDAVTDAKFRDGAAYSIVGRGSGTSGNTADILLSDTQSSNCVVGRVNGGNISRLQRRSIRSLAFPRPRVQHWEENFVGGLLTDGNIGRTGMRLYGVGTPAVTKNADCQYASSDRVTLSTSGSSGDVAALGWHSAATGGFTTSRQTYLYQAVLYLPATVTNYEFWFGLTDGAATASGVGAMTDFLGLIFTSAQANWRRFSRSNGVQIDDVSTGVAGTANTPYNLVLVNEPADTWEAFINNVSVGIFSATLPQDNLHPAIGVRTATAGVRSVHPYYLNWVSRTLTGASQLANDDFIDELVTRG